MNNIFLCIWYVINMFKVRLREICSHAISLIWNTAAGLMNTSGALALHTYSFSASTNRLVPLKKKAGKCKVKTAVLWMQCENSD